jgi:hypothetical protein
MTLEELYITILKDIVKLSIKCRQQSNYRNIMDEIPYQNQNWEGTQSAGNALEEIAKELEKLVAGSPPEFIKLSCPTRQINTLLRN